MKKIFFLFLFIFCQHFFASAQVVPDSISKQPRVTVTLENKMVKTGYLITDTEEEIKIWSEKFGFLKISKIQVKEIVYMDQDQIQKNKNYSTDDSNYVHHNAMTNSAYAPKKGDIYIRAPFYLVGCVDYGITNHLTLGLDAFYFAAVNLNLRYSFDLSEKSKLAVAVGSYYSYIGGVFSSNSALLSARAVYTFGSPDRNISVGGTFITNFRRVETGLVNFSSITKISPRTYFLTDIVVAPSLRSMNLDVNYFGIGFLGIRIKTRKDNRIDLGFANIVTETSYPNFNGNIIHERYYVPAPYVQVVYKL